MFTLRLGDAHDAIVLYLVYSQGCRRFRECDGVVVAGIESEMSDPVVKRPVHFEGYLWCPLCDDERKMGEIFMERRNHRDI